MNNNAQIFIKSVEQNNISSIAALLATGCFDVNAPLRQTLQTPLWHAAASGRGEIVALLLDADADIDRVNALLETPCHAATRNDHADVVAQLVARGTDLRLRDRHGFTPLDIAILDRNKRITSALLAAGDVAATADRTKLCDAATIDRHIVQLLLDLRVDVSALRAGHSHYTACHLAAWRNAGAVVDALVNLAGVDVDERDSVGRTPCHVAAASRNAAALGALVLAGADFDLRCDVRRSPLHNACRDETAQCVLVLLAVGAEIGARDAFGQTACHVAARFGAELALHALLAVGADFDARDNAGETPRQLAAKRRIAAPTADELECARRHINRTQLAFVRERALAICVALQALELDALRTCEILRHACGPVAPFVHFHDDGEALLRPTMTLLLLLILVLAALPSATAHMKIYYEPSNLPIRSAKSPTDDGEWTIDSTGCGGQSQWGKNGVSDVKLGQVISLKFNYGNGERC
jgi:ankyrin repeat protein